MCLRLVSWGRTYCYTNQLTCDRNGGEGSDLVWLGCGDAVPKEVCVCLQQTGMHHGSHARFLHLFLALGLLGRGRGLLPGKCASSSEKGHLSRFDAFVHFSGPGKVQILIKGVVAKRLNNPTENRSWEEAMACCKEDLQTPSQIIVETCGTCIYAMLSNSVLRHCQTAEQSN